jgi:hypothetical protein
MKTVFDNSMTAHVWAQNQQDHGRSHNGNLYFEGGVIYSYGSHFPIARHAVTKQGKPCVLRTTERYSTSTSGHVSHVDYALNPCRAEEWRAEEKDRNKHLIFYVPDPLASTKAEHLENYKALRGSYAGNLHSALFGKDFHDYGRGAAFDRVEEYAQSCRDYSKAFGLGQRVTVPTETLARKKAQWLVDKAAHDAEQEKRAEKRRVARAARYKRMVEKWTVGEVDHLPYDAVPSHEQKMQRASIDFERWASGEIDQIPYWINRYGPGLPDERMFRPTQEQQDRRDAIEADKIKSWRDGKEVRLRFGYGDATTMMRIKGDEVQTSKGARFPVEHAKRAFHIVARCKRNGVDWVRNGHSIQVGHFTLDRIHPNGDVLAGCHFVKWEEIELCARELGILTEETV